MTRAEKQRAIYCLENIVALCGDEYSGYFHDGFNIDIRTDAQEALKIIKKG